MYFLPNVLPTELEAQRSSILCDGCTGRSSIQREGGTGSRSSCCEGDCTGARAECRLGEVRVAVLELWLGVLGQLRLEAFRLLWLTRCHSATLAGCVWVRPEEAAAPAATIKFFQQRSGTRSARKCTGTRTARKCTRTHTGRKSARAQVHLYLGLGHRRGRCRLPLLPGCAEDIHSHPVPT